MGFFTGNTRDKVQTSLKEEVRTLSTEVAGLRGERDSIGEELGLSREVQDLTKKVSNLEIRKSQYEEENARKEREIEHKLGLLEIQREKEREVEKREATVTAREESVNNKATQLEERIAFMTTSFDAHVARMEGVVDSIIDRIPKVNVDHAVSVAAGAAHAVPDSAE